MKAMDQIHESFLEPGTKFTFRDISIQQLIEQREACADGITEEEKDDQLIYSQTEAIRSLVKQTPLVTTKTDSDENNRY